MASCGTIPSKEQFLCPICLDVFTAPVTIPCGHNYCKTCITHYWDTATLCMCPMCRATYPDIPQVSVNTCISELVNHFRKDWDRKDIKGKLEIKGSTDLTKKNKELLGKMSSLSLTLANSHMDVYTGGDEFLIGGNGNGTWVFKGIRDDGTKVAVKKMCLGDYEVLEKETDLLRLTELDDPSIVRYLDFKKDRNFGYIVLQLCEYSLEEYIKLGIEFPGGHLPEKAVAQQVLTGLKMLHHQNPPIVHGNIKPENVFIDVTRKVRLADFGIRKPDNRGQTEHKARKGARSSCWMAKETLILTELPVFTESDGTRIADIQVAGMLLYYLLSGGHHPFGKHPRCEGNILDAKYNLAHVQDVLAKDLIERMINEDPKKRPTVERCLDHPYFCVK